MSRFTTFAFVPKHEPSTVADVSALQKFIDSMSRILVLTGAGISTESGIPDYRSEGVGLYSRSTRRPVTIQQFISSRDLQRRYWARNYFAWPRFAALKPNKGHSTIRNWEIAGKVSALVTQNVDGLHQQAGSVDAIELHGTGHLVICMQCDYQISRQLFQNILLDLNSHLDIQPNPEDVRPDGDIELIDEVQQRFTMPLCPNCSTGTLKPHIVFFGDNVPRSLVDQIYNALKVSDSLLILGSSLQTFSSYRYILEANQRSKPVAIVNLGETRADKACILKISRRLGEILQMIKV